MHVKRRKTKEGYQKKGQSVRIPTCKTTIHNSKEDKI
jgi:hypothetical protein